MMMETLNILLNVKRFKSKRRSLLLLLNHKKIMSVIILNLIKSKTRSKIMETTYIYWDWTHKPKGSTRFYNANIVIRLSQKSATYEITSVSTSKRSHTLATSAESHSHRLEIGIDTSKKEFANTGWTKIKLFHKTTVKLNQWWSRWIEANDWILTIK